MATTYGSYVDILLGKYIDARNANTSFQTYRNQAQNYYNTGYDHEALGSLLTACSYVWQSLNFLIGYTGPSFPYYSILQVLTRDFEYTYETTLKLPLCMEQLTAAMLLATPDEITYFIGLEDAYRQSIWNKPFNSEFFAALARGFQQWP